MNTESRYVILNWGLPAIPSFPSPAMSILKSQLTKYGYEVKVVYWNFHLKPVVTHYWGNDKEEYTDHLVYYLSPIYAYLAVESNDEESITLLYEQWKKTNNVDIDREKFVAHIAENITLLRTIVKNTIVNYHYENCLFTGFYQKLFQIYCSDIIARELKQLYPNTICCLGGIDTKAEAISSLDNFPVFDHALWGEGEMTILAYIKSLNGNLDKNLIGNFAWRESNVLVTSKINRDYLNLNETPLPDYSDYFQQKTIEDKQIRLPIEGSRGCHWSRCKFCFHNEGVRYRRKSPKNIANEIRLQIEEYGIYQISFLDNDTIGKDLIAYDELLDELIAIKKDYPQFYISRAEIVTRYINADIVLKMVEAGFKDVQIGYESLSDTLLTAINKCNSFSTNFLFLKWALTYGIKIRGANLIMNLLEENDDNLQESLENLHFLRFMLDKNRFMHIYTTLWIKESSKYYKLLKNKGELSEWKVYKSFKYLPKSYIKDENKHTLQFFVKPDYHLLWDDIENKEWEYFNNIHRYEISSLEGDFLYKEYRNDEIIESFVLDETDWRILCSANRNVISIKELPIEENELTKQKLKILKQKGVLYYNDDYSNIVTVINTEAPHNKPMRYTDGI